MTIWEVKLLPLFTLYTTNSGISLLYGSNGVSKRVTVVCEKESTKPCLCSKLSLFKTPWQILEVQLQLSSLDSSLPYLRPLKWVTVWLYNSRSIKHTACQSWKCQNFNFQLWLVTFFIPLEVEGNTVPHLKGLRCGKDESTGLSCGWMLSECCR